MPAVDTLSERDRDLLSAGAEVPAWLSALASLTSLAFKVGSLLPGVDHAARLAGLAQLRKLTLWVFDDEHQDVDDPLPAGLPGLPQLTSLKLRVTGELSELFNPNGLSQLSALRGLRWYPTHDWGAWLPAGVHELRSLRWLELAFVDPQALRPGPCWAGLTRLVCNFRPCTATVPPVLALATALERLELGGLLGLDAAAIATLARLPALRHLGLPGTGMQFSDAERVRALDTLLQACPTLILIYDSTHAFDYDFIDVVSSDDESTCTDDGSWAG